MLTYNVRGGLGTQLLNLMAAYGDAFDQDSDIEKIVLNFFNYPNLFFLLAYHHLVLSYLLFLLLYN